MKRFWHDYWEMGGPLFTICLIALIMHIYGCVAVVDTKTHTAGETTPYESVQ